MNRVSWSPDGNWLASAWNDGVIRILDGHTAQLKAICHSSEISKPAHDVSWSPDSQRVVAGYMDGYVRAWDAFKATPLWKAYHPEAVHSVSWSAQNLIASGSTDGCARIWQADNGQTYATSDERPGDTIYGLSWSPTGSQLAIGYARGGALAAGEVWQVS